jgi:16S rRNA pseudouridine516 synthase
LRIDKFLTGAGVASRTEASKAAKRGLILVNGAPVKKADVHIDPESDKIIYCGREITYRKWTYVMLNKPEGYVSATEDTRDPTVLELLPEEYQKIGLFPCGRLDKYTLGLMLLTDNGQLAHRLLSPAHHVEKKYYFRCAEPLSEENRLKMEEGVVIDGGYRTKPSEIEMKGEAEGIITLTEGKYHQIKQMFDAVRNKIIYLERVTFGPLSLYDSGLERGEWRLLTDEEIKKLEN